ncbi:adhesin [Virgibacillus dakarensis]|uniref:Adhesin n=1 Tax=Lentibacillus populi TaxID=1827502 RepID=A0A9W5X4K2_9BACI|nr:MULTISPECIES: zinc ABC transporter substrate-binding protein [Bacillaceae]MBT2217607.1 zinc ABC transporter substrate-binding protein [Virgibacillus dakarensis]MTW84727.1 adhesin [Virgibacillus dakarensis]GGB36293.1 adhesin [Lentibacillus populi]
MKRNVIIITFILLALTVAGCNAAKDSDKEGLTIYTSIYPIQYAVERIGGDTVDAKSVYPPGVDAHTYEPTTKTMTSIASGDAFIYLGAGMEGFAESAADALQSEGVQLVELGKHEELFHTDAEHHEDADHADDGHHHGDHNPHIWLDPLRMIDMADLIKQELIELNPDKKTLYTDNFNALKEDLLNLDNSYQETLKAKANKKILVTHAAYGYWEERYGIEQVAIKGLSSSDEPSQKELTSIIDQAKEYKLHYILFEQNSSDRVSTIMQDQLGAKVLRIHNLSVLTEDDIKNEEDYLSLMKHNLEVLDKAIDEGR